MLSGLELERSELVLVPLEAGEETEKTEVSYEVLQDGALEVQAPIEAESEGDEGAHVADGGNKINAEAQVPEPASATINDL